MHKRLLISIATTIVVALSFLAVNSPRSDASNDVPAGSDSPAVEAGDNGVATNSAFAPKSNRSFGRSGNVAQR